MTCGVIAAEAAATRNGMTEVIPFLGKAILFSYAFRALCHGCFLGKRIFVNMKEINDLCHCCNGPREDIKQIQGRNGFKVGKYSVDPDNAEYAGSHDNDEHGGKAFA